MRFMNLLIVKTLLRNLNGYSKIFQNKMKNLKNVVSKIKLLYGNKILLAAKKCFLSFISHITKFIIIA